MIIDWYSHYFSPEVGAPSARINDLSRCFIKRGHHVHVNTCYPNHPKGVLYPGYTRGMYMEEEIGGIGVSRYWTYIASNRGFIRKLIGHISFLFSSLIQSQRSLLRPDVIIGTSPTFFAAIAAAVKSFLLRKPFVMEVRDLWPAIFVELGVLKNPLLIGLLERLERWLYHRADRVVTVTQAFRQDLIRRGVPPEKVSFIPNGADVDYWIPKKKDPQVLDRLGLENKFVVLYIGAHGISHALKKVLDCAALLKDHPHIHFLFVGDGAEKAMLMKCASDACLDNVTFHDSVSKDDVGSFYALSDICLVPLRDIPLFDSFIPSKMFEIMAMARPIVASLKGEAADIIKCSGSGIVVPPEDSVSIKDAILSLYENPNKHKALGENGRRFVCEHYSRLAMADRYLEVLADATRAFSKKRL